MQASQGKTAMDAGRAARVRNRAHHALHYNGGLSLRRRIANAVAIEVPIIKTPMIESAIAWLLQLLAAPEVGLTSVFIISFISATLLPLGS
jgi:hypothetical protein